MLKLLAAGGNAVMLGSMFAGTDEAPGETEPHDVSSRLIGMGSIAAMKKGSSDRYFQGSAKQTTVPEGIEGRVAYSRAAADIVFQMIGGYSFWYGLLWCS